MRLLLLHADRFAFSVTGEASVAGHAGDPDAATAQSTMDEVLVALVAVEDGDAADVDDVVAQAAALVVETAGTLGAQRVMIYPYAHLSSDLASPRVAADAVERLFRVVSTARLTVERAPFGYYKSFEVAVKGHPLSELARSVLPSGEKAVPASDSHEAQAIQAERTLRSEWRIYHPDGSYEQAESFDFSDHEPLRQLYAYEREGTRTAEAAPPHIKLMREQELVDYEPASDTGNLRWYPKGILVKRLLEQHVSRMVVDYGAMEVETPIMYDYGHPALSKYLNRFPARQYVVNSDDKEYFLRFAACFGQYMMMHDLVASYRNLPVRLYELTHFSFRREQGGEVAGLRRLRAFTMPDMHTMVRDSEMAKEEFLGQVRLCLAWIDDIGIDCVPAIRFVSSFLDEHPEFVRDLMAMLSRPVLVEVWDERFFYFVTKFELNFIDAAEKAACLSTVQIDVENTERFGIFYTTEDGSRQHPLLMHTSVSGSVDRNVYAMLEQQAQLVASGAKAQWQLWLAPIQVRLLPVADDHVEGARALAARIPFRVDIDDRDMRLGKKVREAEKEWVPYTIVIGARELESDATLTVRPRVGGQFETTLEDFLAVLDRETAGKPRLPANTARSLTARPIFVG